MNQMQIKATCEALLEMDSYPDMDALRGWFDQAASYAMDYCPGILDLIGEARAHSETWA